MDRSRIIVSMAMVLSLFSVIIGILNIARSGHTTKFTETRNFFAISGKSGIARIELYGTIEDGYGSPGVIGADSIVKLLRDAEESDRIRAVILAINSPGGTVGGTKKIYDAVRELRKTKPVVAVVSDMAASGGYYIASAADRILAYEGSILGSVGVISYQPDVSGFMNQYGLKMEVIKSGNYKDIMSPFRAMTESERKLIQSMLDDAHQQFVSDVSIGRNQPITTVRLWADGRVFSGKAARAEQIIDDFGGESEAVQIIKLLLKTTDDLPVYYPERDFFDELLNALSGRPFSFGTGYYGRDSGICSALSHPGGLHYIYPGSVPHILRVLRCGGQN